MNGDDKSYLAHVAVHEAAHAVIGHERGLHVDSIEIDSNGGRVNVYYNSDSQSQNRDVAIVGVVGSVAEQIVFGQAHMWRHSPEDESCKTDYYRSGQLSDEFRLHEEKQLRVDAVELVHRYRDVIMLVADDLYRAAVAGGGHASMTRRNFLVAIGEASPTKPDPVRRTAAKPEYQRAVEQLKITTTMLKDALAGVGPTSDYMERLLEQSIKQNMAIVSDHLGEVR